MPFVIRQYGAKAYLTEKKGHITRTDKEIADRIDEFLESAVPQVEEKLSQKGLLELKGKNGAIKLWYETGLELRRLWEEVRTRFNLPDTELKLFLRAAHDHANILKADSRADRLSNSYFYYCYLLAQFPRRFLESAGNWTAWVEFLDSPRVREDKRILEWFVSRSPVNPPMGYSKLKWLRALMRSMRERFRKVDTTLLSNSELFEKLDEVLKKLESESSLGGLMKAESQSIQETRTAQ